MTESNPWQRHVGGGPNVEAPWHPIAAAGSQMSTVYWCRSMAWASLVASKSKQEERDLRFKF
jgi:hypothetical protein